MRAMPPDWADHDQVPVLDDQRFSGTLLRRPYLFRRQRIAARNAWAALDQLQHGRPAAPLSVEPHQPATLPLRRQLRQMPRRVWGHTAMLALVLGVVLTGGLPQLAMQLDWNQGAEVATDNLPDVAEPYVGMAAPQIIPYETTPDHTNASAAKDALVPSMQPQAPIVPSAYVGTHTVAPGETLGQIATHDNVPVTTLLATNNITPSMIPIGATLRIPQVAGLPHTVIEGETVERIAELYNVPASAIRSFPANNLSKDRALSAGEELYIPGAVPIGNGPSADEMAAATAVAVGTVLDNETRVRAGPSTEYDKIAALPADAQVALVGRYENWFQIRTKNGTEGWVAAELLGTADGLADQVAVVSEIPALPTPEPVAAAPAPAQPEPAAAPKPQPSKRWVWPTTGDLTSGYGYRNMKVGRFHNGYDIANGKWTPIVAASAGRVIEAGWCSGYGYCVKIDHGNGLIGEYGHMAAMPNVRRGQQVSAGDRIGSMGMTYDAKGGGYASGVHLHFTLKQNGKAVNPGRYLR